MSGTALGTSDAAQPAIAGELATSQPLALDAPAAMDTPGEVRDDEDAEVAADPAEILVASLN